MFKFIPRHIEEAVDAPSVISCAPVQDEKDSQGQRADVDEECRPPLDVVSVSEEKHQHTIIISGTDEDEQDDDADEQDEADDVSPDVSHRDGGRECSASILPVSSASVAPVALALPGSPHHQPEQEEREEVKGQAEIATKLYPTASKMTDERRFFQNKETPNINVDFIKRSGASSHCESQLQQHQLRAVGEFGTEKCFKSNILINSIETGMPNSIETGGMSTLLPGRVLSASGGVGSTQKMTISLHPPASGLEAPGGPATRLEKFQGALVRASIGVFGLNTERLAIMTTKIVSGHYNGKDSPTTHPPAATALISKLMDPHMSDARTNVVLLFALDISEFCVPLAYVLFYFLIENSVNAHNVAGIGNDLFHMKKPESGFSSVLLQGLIMFVSELVFLVGGNRFVRYLSLKLRKVRPTYDYVALMCMFLQEQCYTVLGVVTPNWMCGFCIWIAQCGIDLSDQKQNYSTIANILTIKCPAPPAQSKNSHPLTIFLALSFIFISCLQTFVGGGFFFSSVLSFSFSTRWVIA